MKILMVASFALAIAASVMNEFSPFSLVLVVVTGMGAVHQYMSKGIEA